MGVIHSAPCHKCCPRSRRQITDWDRLLNVAIRRGRGETVQRRSRRILTACHAVNGIIDDNRGDVNVAPRCMNEMIAPDSYRVSISHHNNDVHIWSEQLKP